VVQRGHGQPMDLHGRRSDHGELVRGVDHGRGAGGGLLGMEVVEDHVREGLGEDLRRMEVVGHGAGMGQPHDLLRESRWAGLELRALGLAEEKEVHGARELHVFRRGAGRAGMATVPKGSRSTTRLLRCRGCRQRQGG